MHDMAFTYEVLDDLAVAVEDGALSDGNALPASFTALKAGPLLELMLLGPKRCWPHYVTGRIAEGPFKPLMVALRGGSPLWFCGSGMQGFMRLGDAFGDDEEIRWTGFGLKADKAMQTAGLAAGLAGQLVGATKELHSNVYEHSERSRTGLVAFAVHEEMAEFIVADSGIGVLASLRSNPAHAMVAKDGEALRLALQPGVSRHAGETLRGHGFDLMFTGLLNRNSKLRFRSGAAAVTIDGCADGSPVPIIRERPAMQGFLIAVECFALNTTRIR